MRVVGGTARGRALRVPPGTAIRPTSDRVREAVFSMLSSLDRIEGATVADLFAGSGALGIESLSRGAESAVFVDSSPEAVAAIRDNLEVLGLDRDRQPDRDRRGYRDRRQEPARQRAEVVRSDVLHYLAAAPRFDLVFADPPYAFDRWPELLGLLVGRSGLLVAEAGVSLDPGPGWETVKVKRYGGTVVCIAQPVIHVSVPRAEEGEP